ncbi:MAG: hypothetical protein ABFS34_07785 [Gemmatimonadota bacterium]
MSRATLTPPRRPPDGPVQPPPDSDRAARAALRPSAAERRDVRERRVFRAALVASVLAHVAILLLIRLSPGFRPVPTGPVPASERDPGLRLLQFEAVEGEVDELARPDDPEATPRPSVRPAPPSPEPPGEPAGEQLTAVDRLRPGAVRDPRLWRDHGPAYLLPPETPEEAILRGLLPRLALLNDSIAAELEADRRASDWTFTDSQGRRWGISSEGIHLGTITLPPVAFNASEERRQEIEAALREWSTIRDQAYRAGLNEEFEDRVRAIRERVERERGERSEGGESK